VENFARGRSRDALEDQKSRCVLVNPKAKRV
jgi:hypothetical protein